MKIFEIFEKRSTILTENSKRIVVLLSEESTDLSTLELAIRSALIAINTASRDADEALEWRDSSRVLPIMGPLYRWFRDNFETGKVSGRGYGLKTILRNLSEKSPKVKRVVSEIMPMLSDIADPKSEARIGVEARFYSLFSALEEVARAAIPNYKSPNISNASEQLQRKIKQLRSIKSSDTGVDRAKTPKTIDKTPAAIGKQNSQVEEIINQVLKTLPADKAAELRKKLAKSDNKLQMLRQELSAHE